MHSYRRETGTTFEILGCQEDGADVVVLDKMADLGGYLGAIPSHNQHLANGPGCAAIGDVSAMRTLRVYERCERCERCER